MRITFNTFVLKINAEADTSTLTPDFLKQKLEKIVNAQITHMPKDNLIA